jgi:FkbM family methyltransferase
MKSLVNRIFPGALQWLRRRRLFWMGYIWTQYWIIGEYELKELHNYVDRNRVSLDVGGNIGCYAYHLSRLSRSVVTFEPNPYFIERIRMLNIRNVQIVPMGVSDQAGEAQLRIPAFWGDEVPGMASLSTAAVSDEVVSRQIEVPLCRIDQFDRDDVGFIKIDVEGHEESVIHGALGTIARCKPNILVEIEERHNRGGLGRIRALLEGAGYTGYFFLKGQRLPIAQFDEAKHQQAPDNINSFYHTRRGMTYVNNFLFLPQA